MRGILYLMKVVSFTYDFFKFCQLVFGVDRPFLFFVKMLL